MSHLSPPYGPAEINRVETTISTPRAYTAAPGPSNMSGLAWQNGQPVLRMQDAVVETIVTHTTRTTTSFAPIPLPRLPEPDHLPLPTHLSPERYPLALKPVPEDTKFFAMNIGGQRVVVQEDGSMSSLTSPLPTEIGGPGWKRSMQTSGLRNNMPRMNLAGAIGGRDIRKRPLSTSIPGGMGSTAPTPPVTGDGKTRARSPPRKRVRGLDDITFQEGALLSPLPSPGEDAGDPLEQRSTPTIGTGTEFAALLSLPALINHFDTLPDKLQQHIMMQFLRRSRMSTIQRVTSFASSALKRDFVTQLPHEVAVNILKFVDTKTLTRATRVNHKWRRLIDSERVVWKQRMIDDDLWQGVGTEEEEEGLIKRRMETIRWKAGLRAMEPDADLDDEELMEMVSAGLGPDADSGTHDRLFPIPMKHVYRRRYMSERNWLGRTPTHRSFLGHGTHVVTCTQFDRDKLITASDDHSINVYDIRQGTLRKRLDGHDGGVWALEYRGNTLVTGSTDRTVRIWDLETFTEAHCFLGHKSTVRCLQIVEPVLEANGEYFPPYPIIVTGSRDGDLRIWRLPNKGELRANEYTIEGEEIPLQPEKNPFHLQRLKGHEAAVRALAAYGRLCMSGSYDCTVRVWDIVKGTCLHVLSGHEAKVYSVVYDRHRNRCASGSMDNTVRVWDVGTGECLHVLDGHTALVGLLAMSSNHLVSAAADASLRIWDANTESLRHIFDSHGGAITCFAHDETKVVSGAEGCLKLWDMRTGQFVRDLVSGISSVWQVVFKDNMLVAATSRGGGTVFEVFNFGEINDPSGVDDESLDKFRRPAWQRIDPATQGYQYGGNRPARSGPEGGNGRAHQNNGVSRGSKARRSARIATKSGLTSAQASGSQSWRGTYPGQWDTLQPLESPSRRYYTRASTSQLHPQSASVPHTILRSAVAGPSQTRSVARRTSEMARRSDSPTPIGTSSGIDMLRATSRSGYRDQEEEEDDDEEAEGAIGREEEEVDWEVERYSQGDEYATGRYYAQEDDEGDEQLDEEGEGDPEDWDAEVD